MLNTSPPVPIRSSSSRCSSLHAESSRGKSKNPVPKPVIARLEAARPDAVVQIIGRFGMAIGEMFVLDPLAADCADDGVYECFFTSAPLNIPGGTGSPPNALCFK